MLHGSKWHPERMLSGTVRSRLDPCITGVVIPALNRANTLATPPGLPIPETQTRKELASDILPRPKRKPNPLVAASEPGAYHVDTDHEHAFRRGAGEDAARGSMASNDRARTGRWIDWDTCPWMGVPAKQSFRVRT
jgi:hypothetical protein